MSYSNFTFSKLKNKYGIELKEGRLFSGFIIPDFSVSKRLREDMEQAKGMPLLTEKAKSENIITPIMWELKRNNEHIAIFSGYTLNIEGDNDLKGNPDYLIAAKPQIVEPQRPVFCIFETKNKQPDEGYAQCAAEMYAAYLFNQQTGEDTRIIYGAVTNAFEWVFLKLEDNHIYIDINRYYLNQLPLILGIMQYIVNQYKQD